MSTKSFFPSITDPHAIPFVIKFSFFPFMIFYHRFFRTLTVIETTRENPGYKLREEIERKQMLYEAQAKLGDELYQLDASAKMLG